jgi:hypothetical protein
MAGIFTIMHLSSRQCAAAAYPMRRVRRSETQCPLPKHQRILTSRRIRPQLLADVGGDAYCAWHIQWSKIFVRADFNGHDARRLQCVCRVYAGELNIF